MINTVIKIKKEDYLNWYKKLGDAIFSFAISIFWQGDIIVIDESKDHISGNFIINGEITGYGCVIPKIFIQD